MSRILWLHEDALRTHPVAADRVIHVWDDAYLQTQGYSLKRLVFLYETLCELPEVELLCGATTEVLTQLAPCTLLIPATPNLFVRDVAAGLSAHTTTQWLSETPFAIIREPRDYRRFSQYWKEAEKTAFQTDGGAPHA